MTYFMIYNSDGDTRVIPMSKEELLKRVQPEDEEDQQEFFNTFPDNKDTNYWGDKALIIKGEIVSPRPLTSVVTWDIA